MPTLIPFNLSFDTHRKVVRSLGVEKYISFSGTSGNYASVPLAVLSGATTFTIEVKFSTTQSKTSTNNWQWGTIVGREIGGNWKNDFGLCVNDGKLCFWAEPSSGGSSSTNNTVSNAVVNDGLFHKVAVVSSNGAIDLFCDGVNVAHTNNVNAKISTAQTMLLAYDSDANSYLQMNLAEVRFWNVARSDIWADIDGTENGLQAWLLPNNDGLIDFSGNSYHATLYGSCTFSAIPAPAKFDTKRKVVKSVSANFDTAIFPKWIYQNFGTADLLLTSGETVQLDDALFKSAFWGSTSQTANFQIPSGVKEIWIKLNLFLTSNFVRGNRFYFGHYSATLGGYVGVWNGTNASGDISFLSFLVDAMPTTAKYSGIKATKAQNHSVLLHMVSDATNGVIELTVDDSTYTYTGNVNNGADFDCIGFYSDSANALFSNIIVSNSAVSISDNALLYFSTNFDTCRRVIRPFAFSQNFDTKRKVVRSVISSCDTFRKVVCSVNPSCDTLRKVVRSVHIFADTERKIPHSLDFLEGKFQNVDISLNAQQLTENFSFTTIKNIDILQQVKGSLLDFIFNLRVESLSIQDDLITCQCCSDIDELLYTQIAYKLGRSARQGGFYIVNKDSNTTKMVKKPYANASAHINKIASILKKNPVLLFADFISTVDIEQEGVTYQDLINEIFGWTSRIPHKLINVFIRDDNLYVVQRGYEQNSFDISNAILANLVLKKDIVRTSWGVTHSSTTDTVPGDWEPVLGNPIEDDKPVEDEDDENDDEPDEESRVLPSDVTTTDNGVTTHIHYTYDNDGNVIETRTTTEKSVGNSITVDGKSFSGNFSNGTLVIVRNRYGTINNQKMLIDESTTEFESEYSVVSVQTDDGNVDSVRRNWVLTNSKNVHHEYLTQGQQHVSNVDSDGEVLGSVTTPARNDDRPTPYDDMLAKKSTVDRLDDNFSGDGSHGYTYQNGQKIEVIGWTKSPVEKSLDTLALYDSSFPVDDNAAKFYTNELKRLNRKIQYTVTVDLFDYPHIFDFNDQIILFGHSFFLQSNTVSITSDITNKQSLQLVRWDL